MSKLDLTKPLRTREGGDAGAMVGPHGRLYGWLFNVNCGKPELNPQSMDWDPDGHCDVSGWCLENTPETRTVKVWLNVYPPRRNSAGEPVAEVIGFTEPDQGWMEGRLACIEREITYTVGEGLKP